MNQEDKLDINQNKTKLKSNNQIDLSSSNHRVIRPSVFLNEINFLPTISPSTNKNKLEVPILKNEQQTIFQRTKTETVPLLPILESARRNNKGAMHKPTQSMPTYLTKLFKLSNDQESVKKEKDNLKLETQSPKLSIHLCDTKQEKNVQFRKSIFIVDILNGIYQKGTIDGRKKPLRKLVKSRLSKQYF